MKTMFFIALVSYALAVALEFTGTAFKKDKLLKTAWYVFLAAFAVTSEAFIVFPAVPPAAFAAAYSFLMARFCCHRE